MGSWTIYGLGSESESLPAYVVMPDPGGTIEAGQPVYSNAFLPSIYQPNVFRAGKKPVLNLDMPPGLSIDQRQANFEADPRSRPIAHGAGRRRIRRAHERLRPGVQDADRSSRGVRYFQRAAPRCRNSTVSATRHRRLRTPLPARAAAGRKGRALRRAGVRRSRNFAVGRPRRHRREPSADGRQNGPADRRTAEGPEAARAARFHAGRLGRRIRPHAGSARRQRAATTTTSASRCGWPAAA